MKEHELQTGNHTQCFQLQNAKITLHNSLTYYKLKKFYKTRGPADSGSDQHKMAIH
jgi:hypothetical protein